MKTARNLNPTGGSVARVTGQHKPIHFLCEWKPACKRTLRSRDARLWERAILVIRSKGRDTKVRDERFAGAKIEAERVNVNESGVNGTNKTSSSSSTSFLGRIVVWMSERRANTRGRTGSTLKYRHIKARNVHRMVEITSPAMARRQEGGLTNDEKFSGNLEAERSLDEAIPSAASTAHRRRCSLYVRLFDSRAPTTFYPLAYLLRRPPRSPVSIQRYSSFSF